MIITISVDTGENPKLDQIITILKEIKMTDAEVKALLDKVDATTTNIATNVGTIASAQQVENDTIQKISDEIDTLLANPSSGISPATAAQLQGIADRLQTSSDNSDKLVAATNAQVPVLQAIAAKGTPVVPPAPEPVPVPAPPVVQP